MKVLITIGKRSEIIKTAPVIDELRKKSVSTILVDVQQQKGWFMKGSHYMDLDFQKPDYTIEFKESDLENLLDELFNIVCEEKPIYLISSGGSITTLATTIVSQMAKVPFLHIESGYRTYNLDSSEEVRRHLIDAFSSLCFAPSRLSYVNLMSEGIKNDQIFLTGSTVIDTLVRYIDFARSHSKILEELELVDEDFSLITLHKKENVTETKLRELLSALKSIDHFFVMPVHPETGKFMKKTTLYDEFLELENLLMIEPLDYIDFIALESSSKFVITDSGTVSEESSFLGKPTIIVGETTRVELINEKLALNIDLSKEEILKKVKEVDRIKVKRVKVARIYGSGYASEKIADLIERARITFNPKLRYDTRLSFPKTTVIDLENSKKPLTVTDFTLVSAIKGKKPVQGLADNPTKLLILINENNCKSKRKSCE